MALILLIAALALLTGFLSGLLGIGGGIIMAPLLLFIPPVMGFETLPMQLVAGLTVVQGLLAAVAGAFVHFRLLTVSMRLCKIMGPVIFIAALLGGAGAKWVANEILLIVFSMLAAIAAFLLFTRRVAEEEYPDVKQVVINPGRAILTAVAVGGLGGLVGQGGSFLLIPLMIYFVRIPTRIAIGSNLVIVIFSTVAGIIGKSATGQIDWTLAAPIILTVIPGTLLGSALGHRVQVLLLRRILAILIAVAACRMWWTLLVT
jgi:uncharacterized membrane protein YfcA